MKLEAFDKAAAYFPDICFKMPPDLGIVFGSGWGSVIEKDEILFHASYADIPMLGASTVKGHAGEFFLYRRHNKLVAAWCGRRHYYEGQGWEPVVLPVEMLRRMGCGNLLVTNAAGGVNRAFKPGDLMLLKDHVNVAGVNPLIGAHVPDWGERFPDMSEVYSTRLAEIMHDCADALGTKVVDGIYAFNSGPVYETPAEIRALSVQGVDAVGMSTIPEATFAKACGMNVVGLSLISNLAAGISPSPLNHAEVIAAGESAKPKMRDLIDEFINRL